MSFYTSQEELRKLVYSPDIYSVNLNIDGKECKAIMKELQFHPVTDQLLHVDFYEITEEKPIVMEVPIQMTGLAEGVKAGGKLAASVRKLSRCYPAPLSGISSCRDSVAVLGLGSSAHGRACHLHLTNNHTGACNQLEALEVQLAHLDGLAQSEVCHVDVQLLGDGAVCCCLSPPMTTRPTSRQ